MLRRRHAAQASGPLFKEARTPWVAAQPTKATLANAASWEAYTQPPPAVPLVRPLASTRLEKVARGVATSNRREPRAASRTGQPAEAPVAPPLPQGAALPEVISTGDLRAMLTTCGKARSAWMMNVNTD